MLPRDVDSKDHHDRSSPSFLPVDLLLDQRQFIIRAVSTLDLETIEEIKVEEDLHADVATVEPAEQVWGERSQWFLFIGYVRIPLCVLRDSSVCRSQYRTPSSLNNQKTPNYLVFAVLTCESL